MQAFAQEILLIYKFCQNCNKVLRKDLRILCKKLIIFFRKKDGEKKVFYARMLAIFMQCMVK